MNLDKELRIMHACEVGAIGVYRDHKCIARYFFRSSPPDLDGMRLHEKDHTSIIMELLTQRNEEKREEKRGQIYFRAPVMWVNK